LSDSLRIMTEVMAERMFGRSSKARPEDDFSDADMADADMADADMTDIDMADANAAKMPMPGADLRPNADDQPKGPIDEAAKALALAIAAAADDRKAGDITILQTGDISYLADYFVIVTGFSNVQVRAIANAIEQSIAEKFDRLPLRTEGMGEGRWVLKDYGEVIVHIFMQSDREYYDLEAFWGHATRIDFNPTEYQSA
jgi:ribosome-associated protein